MLELASRISAMGFATKTQQMQAEIDDLAEQMEEARAKNKQMQKQMIAMEGEVAEAQDKLELAREENAQLLGEKSALTDAVKSLNKEVSKLKNFKMNLMATLKDDDQVEFANEASGDRLVSSVLQSAKPTASPRQTSGSRMSDRTGAYGSTPVASPARFGSQNQNGSNRSHSSTLTSPSVTGSPGGFGGKVDGKEFFRQARARLSYEKFSQFLSNIKELNAHKQTRQETLVRASEIFGDVNADLYATFETLLVKHLPK